MKNKKDEKNNKNFYNNSSKVIKLSEKQNVISTKKLRTILIVFLLLLVFLLSRLAWIQFIDGDYLKSLAYSQQTINEIISPKRGNIYDSTGQLLATSTQVDTVTVSPAQIKGDTDEETTKLKETIAEGLSTIFSLDYEEVLSKLNSSSSIETIIKKVEQDKITELETWMAENNITSGINIDEDTKRYYPYGSLASQIIGFTGDDNQGLTGLEYSWDSTLTGTSGKLVTSQDATQSEIPNTEETYIAAENGSDITLTIDVNLQTIVEKYLKQAVEENSASRGGNVILMDPSTGDILAMASYPDYDLNSPFTPNSTLQQIWDTLSSDEQKTALQTMWNSKSISETYEPGSTFKIITSAIAIEENITDTDVVNDFLCVGYEEFSDGTIIKCWRTTPHGNLTLREALMNSCNPAFMQLGSRIGASTLYKYYKAFGLFDKTGIDLSGEYTSTFWNLENVGAVELATMSFGQRFTVTPLQLITAISAIANDGILMKPRIVKEVTNTDTGAVTTIDTEEVRQVISKETADKVKSMMESVVTDGTGGNASVLGYSIGGKSGTSEPLSENEDEGYVSSFVAISPIEDTQVVLLLTLYDPQGESYQGGQVAAPVVSQMLSEILPYLGVTSTVTEEENDSTITVPNVTNKTITEAEKILENNGFNVKFNVSGDPDSLLVTSQVPVAGTQLLSDSIVVLYSEENDTRTSVTVPDLKGMTVQQAISALKSKNLNISIEGSGYVINQDYEKNSSVEEGTVIKVTLQETLEDAY